MGPEANKLKGIKEVFSELSVSHDLILKGDRILIPSKIRGDVLGAGHEGCPGGAARQCSDN